MPSDDRTAGPAGEPVDGPRDEDADGGAGGRGGPGAWVLVLAAVLPLAVLAAVVADVLGGALDARFFGTSTSAGGGVTTQVPPGVTAVDRFSLLSAFVPVSRVLLASVLACTALAVLRLAGRPAWVVPGRAASRVAAAVALAGAAAAAAALAALAAATARGSGLTSFSSGSLLFDLAVQGPEALVPVALGAVTAAVLLRPGTPPAPPPPRTGAGVGVPAAAPAETSAETSGEPPEEAARGAGEVAGGPAPAPRPGVPPAPAAPARERAEGAPADAPPAAGYPRPSAEEYALYRRPPR
ncbi:hypothetical protein [Kineococcus sp. SYSU DK005]|uniref:hypothetical protein n=1 Tax=Kineococcus sp. SYSU DK005 TaxID=3383126 RepID=UPI003D7E258F